MSVGRAYSKYMRRTWRAEIRNSIDTKVNYPGRQVLYLVGGRKYK